MADQAHDARPLALDKAIQTLMEHLERDDTSPVTLEIYMSKAGHLVRHFGKKRDILALTEADGLEYWGKRVKEVSPAPSAHTVQKELRLIVQAGRLAERMNLGRLLFKMPKELAQGRVYTPRVRWLPRDTEYPRLLMAMNSARRDYLVAFCFTGLRLGELYRVHAYHIDLERRELDADGTKTKKSKRIIPLSEDAFEVFARRVKQRPEGPLFDDWGKLHRDVRAACKRAGIDPVSPNDLRRTFCSWLANEGVPMLTAARLLGHAGTKMAEQVYAHLSRDAMRDAVGLLDRKAAPVKARKGRA